MRNTVYVVHRTLPFRWIVVAIGANEASVKWRVGWTWGTEARARRLAAELVAGVR